MEKTCPEHGHFEVVVARDPRFYHAARGDRSSPSPGAGSDAGGCGPSCCCAAAAAGPAAAADGRDPFDVLSTCVALIEIVDSCNLACPTCYADSPLRGDHGIECLDLPEVIRLVQSVIDRKGLIDILQLTGGEPTIHPRFFEILEWALRHQSIGYVLINTNGVRLARERPFRERLGELRRALGRFELYLQFDGPQAAGQVELRGADLRELRRRAVDEAGALGVPATLAMVVTPATIGFAGDALNFGLERPHCRGITFQPVFGSGRLPRVEGRLAAAEHAPISVGDVIAALVAQSAGLLGEGDFTPLPCGDPNCHTIGYLLRLDAGPVPLGRLVDLRSLQGFLRDRLDYSLDDLARCGCETEPLGALLKALEIGLDRP